MLAGGAVLAGGVVLYRVLGSSHMAEWPGPGEASADTWPPVPVKPSGP